MSFLPLGGPTPPDRVVEVVVMYSYIYVLHLLEERALFCTSRRSTSFLLVGGNPSEGGGSSSLCIHMNVYLLEERALFCTSWRSTSFLPMGGLSFLPGDGRTPPERDGSNSLYNYLYECTHLLEERALFCTS